MKKILFVLLVFLLTAVAFYYIFPVKAAGLLTDFTADNAGLVKKQVQVDDQTIVYWEGGQGPSILLLHGYAADKSNWLLFAYFLNKKYHVVIPDIPGYGESSKILEASYGLNAQINRLHKFVQAVNLRKFHIVGNSMGGFYAGSYAARYPDEIASLGLFNAGGVKSLRQNELSRLMEKGENPLLLKDDSDFDRLMSLIFFKMPFFPYPLRKTFIQQAIADRSFNEKTLKEFAPDFYSLEQELPRIKAPTLILWGDSDKILDVSSVPVFEEGLRNHKTVILKDCGHAPMIEKPKETAAEYTAFITGINK